MIYDIIFGIGIATSLSIFALSIILAFKLWQKRKQNKFDEKQKLAKLVRDYERLCIDVNLLRNREGK